LAQRKQPHRKRTNVRIARLVVLVAGILLSVCANADPKGDALAKCLGDNTTGKDRVSLARWVILTMATHPELATLAKTTPAEIEADNRTIGRSCLGNAIAH
jgi:hypothetical protein